MTTVKGGGIDSMALLQAQQHRSGRGNEDSPQRPTSVAHELLFGSAVPSRSMEKNSSTVAPAASHGITSSRSAVTAVDRGSPYFSPHKDDNLGRKRSSSGDSISSAASLSTPTTTQLSGADGHAYSLGVCVVKGGGASARRDRRPKKNHP